MAKGFGFVTLGFDDPASFAGEGGGAHQLVASACCIATLDATTEAELSAIVRGAAG